MKTRYLVTILVIALSVLGISACGGGGGGGGGELQTQVSAGETVYNESCAACHDGGAVGPELNAENLSAAFANAQELHDYTAQNMPQNAPGSLTDEQYWNVTAWMVDNAGLMGDNTEPVGAGNAANIPLTQ